jgi:molybdate transport system substrate-binding protein
MYINTVLAIFIKWQMQNNHFNTNKMKRIKILLAVCILLTSPAFSQNLKVAVAANLQAVIKVLQSDFKSKTGADSRLIG